MKNTNISAKIWAVLCGSAPEDFFAGTSDARVSSTVSSLAAYGTALLIGLGLSLAAYTSGGSIINATVVGVLACIVMCFLAALTERSVREIRASRIGMPDETDEDRAERKHLKRMLYGMLSSRMGITVALGMISTSGAIALLLSDEAKLQRLENAITANENAALEVGTLIEPAIKAASLEAARKRVDTFRKQESANIERIGQGASQYELLDTAANCEFGGYTTATCTGISQVRLPEGLKFSGKPGPGYTYKRFIELRDLAGDSIDRNVAALKKLRLALLEAEEDQAKKAQALTEGRVLSQELHNAALQEAGWVDIEELQPLGWLETLSLIRQRANTYPETKVFAAAIYSAMAFIEAMLMFSYLARAARVDSIDVAACVRDIAGQDEIETELNPPTTTSKTTNPNLATAA